ncbi:hypothetical protein ACP70R_041373 [Stipagrostis hirtigluma subsp. patula]
MASRLSAGPPSARYVAELIRRLLPRRRPAARTRHHPSTHGPRKSIARDLL